MDISLETIQELAPDQASLNAAKKLLNPAKWPKRGQASSVNTIWGQCQGSGSNPYYTMADVADHGYKCTCPSRKFPCKHVLALLWQFSESPHEFAEEPPPEWVNDWLGRRRKSRPSDTEQKPSQIKKNIHQLDEGSEKIQCPEEQAKIEAAKVNRAAKVKADTEASICDGLGEFQQWVNDQLRSGMVNFVNDINKRCRQIAARLVDAKAGNLASRIDELPAKILPLDVDQQAHAVLKELGRLVLLCDAWFVDADDPDARRAIATAENREQLLNQSDCLRVSGLWETVGESIYTRRDGLISHSNWLLNISEETPRFALLLDFYPAGTGRREAGHSIGRQMKAEIVYYPSRSPLRALITNQEHLPLGQKSSWAVCGTGLWQGFANHLSQLPWSEYFPCLIGAGGIVTDANNNYWWQACEEEQALPLANSKLNPLLLGCQLKSAFVIWDGEKAELQSAYTEEWGTIKC